jgi:hypothetical protein
MMVSSNDYHSVAVGQAEWGDGFWFPHLSPLIDKDVSEEVSLQEMSQPRSREASGDDDHSLRVWVPEEVTLDVLDTFVVPLKLGVLKAVVSEQESIGKANVPRLLEAKERLKEVVGRHPLLGAD